jgi:PAS domain S-box-containing protein
MTILWSMAAGACLILAIPNLVLWLSRRDSLPHLLFSVAACAAAGVAFGELAMMQADSGASFARAMKLIHLPLTALVLALVWFVVLYLGSRRRVLAWGLSAGWLVTLVVNLMSPYSIVFGELPRLSSLSLPWGETISVGSAAPGSWKHLPDLLVPVLLVLVAGASFAAWKRGARRRAALVGGGCLFFMGLAGVHSLLVDLGVIASPYLISLAFLGVVLAMGLELTYDAARAGELSEEVKASERRWRSLLENVHLLVAGVDRHGRLDYVNPFFSRVTGYSRDELLGQHFSKTLPPDEVGNVERVLQEALAGELSPSAERRLRTKEGQERHVIWSRVILKNSMGEPTGLLSIGADVTERKTAEAARDLAMKDTERALAEVEALKQKLEDEVVYLQDEIKTVGGFDEILGESDALKYVLQKITEVAPLDATVLVEGETGVGKELFARAIHTHSARRSRSLVKVNCAALPENLIESELFGHEKGAFTGAARTRRGRFELADGGTLFLDEIGELAMDLQGKLLRVLQEGEIERVGGDRTIRVDVRIIAATNRNLKKEVESGAFREDLFYRLHVYPITIPPLRKRKEDIPILVNAFVARFAGPQGKQIREVPQPVLDELLSYDWPGNVRELENVIQRAVITSPGQTLRLAARLGPSLVSADSGNGYRGTLGDVERAYILGVLKLTNWRIEGDRGAAELLGIHPNTLRFRMRKLDIKRPVS